MHNHEITEAFKRRDALERQQEILFDIAYYLGALKVHEQDDIMDWMGGSRGLFDHVRQWAAQFDDRWETWTKQGRVEFDYITEIDDFVAIKHKTLVAEYEASQQSVVSIQVIPVITGHDETNEVTPQFNGPTEATTHWAVYTRDAGGLAHWFADTDGEEQAMFIGGALANKHNVQIEAQPWKEQTDGQAN